MGLFDRRDRARDTIAVPTTALVRAPQVATKATQVGTSFGTSARLPAAGGTSWTDEQAWRQAYYANVWVYRCAQVIAEDIAALPIRVGADPSNPGEFDTAHPLAIMLGPPPGSPNPTTSSRRLLMWTVAQYLVTGRWAWEIEYGPDSGLPMFLWPLPSNRITPITSAGGANYFSGYDYDMGKGGTKRLARDRVFYEWKPAATDWREAENVLQAAKLNISVAAMQDRYDYAFLKNDARPATVVVHEEFANVDERDAWRATFTGTHGGVDQAGKVAFAESSPGQTSPKDSLLIQTLGMTAKDARMIERYDATLRLIEAAFGVPRSRLGDASGRTYSNAGEEWAGYYRTTIRSLALEMSDAINTGLAPKFGLDVCWFDFSANEYLRDEPPFPVEEGLPLYRGGVVTLNEFRTKVLYLPPVDDGDDLVVQEAVVVGATEDAGSPNSKDTPDQIVGEVEDDAPPTEADLADTGRQARGARDEQDANVERRRTQWRSFDRTVSRLESKWERSFQRLFDKQMKAVISRLEGKRGRQLVRDMRDTREGDVPPNPDAVFDQRFWLQQTDELSAELYEDVVGEALAQYAAAIDISFDLANPWVQDMIAQRANQLAGQVTTTTFNAIKRQLGEGVGQGESIPKLADRIERLFQQTYKNRATVVARTEVISSYNGATAEAIRLTPEDIAAGQEWLASIDSRTREEHALADGQIVPTGQSFMVGGENLRYPGDPVGSSWNVIQCRCTLAAVRPDRMEPTVPAMVQAGAPQPDTWAPMHVERPEVIIRHDPPPPQQVDLRITVDQGTVRKTILRDDDGNIIGTEETPVEADQ